MEAINIDINLSYYGADKYRPKYPIFLSFVLMTSEAMSLTLRPPVCSGLNAAAPSLNSSTQNNKQTKPKKLMFTSINHDENIFGVLCSFYFLLITVSRVLVWYWKISNMSINPNSEFYTEFEI